MSDLNELLNESIAKQAKEQAEALANTSGGLVSVDFQTKKIEHELSQYVQYAKRRCLEGFDCCIEAVYTNSHDDLQEFDENIKEAFSRFDDTVYVLDMATKAAQGACWKDLLGLTDKTMSRLYEGAKSLFDRGSIPEAEAAFYFLTTVDVSQYAFWLGLGHAAFRLGNFNQSINAYETAVLCEAHSVWPHIYIANCFESMNNYDESLNALELALQECRAKDTLDKELEGLIVTRIAEAKSKLS